MQYRMKRHITKEKWIQEEGVDKLRSTYVKLVALELVLSVVFFTLGHVTGNMYLRGVGIGLVIAWVTGALAYFVVKRRKA
jgi:hypothetical protein